MVETAKLEVGYCDSDDDSDDDTEVSEQDVNIRARATPAQRRTSLTFTQFSKSGNLRRTRGVETKGTSRNSLSSRHGGGTPMDPRPRSMEMSALRKPMIVYIKGLGG
jgi:hypothetical protein